MSAINVNVNKSGVYKVLSIFLLAAVITLFFNNSINWHFHKLSNGCLVVHAHPYQKAATNGGQPASDHHHKTPALLFFQQITNIFFLALVLSGLLLSIILPFRRLDGIPYHRQVSQKVYTHISARGPPLAF